MYRYRKIVIESRLSLLDFECLVHGSQISAPMSGNGLVDQKVAAVGLAKPLLLTPYIEAECIAAHIGA